MRILILGGTNFIGPHFIELATARGHELTLFNRGKTAPDAFAELEQLRGDRKDGDYGALSSGEWDVVVDTCAYWPRAVNEAMAALEGRVGHYLFVSTISVFDEFDEDGYDEDAPLARTDEPDAEEVTPKNYGALKVLCEEALEAWSGPTTIVRPGLVAGPGDPTDRFSYWPVRIARGGTALAPGTPDDPIQYIDVRDLAAFIVRLIDDETTGTFNAVTPRGAHTIGELLDACRSAAENPADLRWVDSEFLHEHDVSAWAELPAWVPAGSPIGGIPHCISERAVDAGLTFTPIGDTVADTLAWFDREELKAGLSADREAEILEEWTS